MQGGTLPTTLAWNAATGGKPPIIAPGPPLVINLCPPPSPFPSSSGCCTVPCDSDAGDGAAFTEIGCVVIATLPESPPVRTAFSATGSSGASATSVKVVACRSPLPRLESASPPRIWDWCFSPPPLRCFRRSTLQVMLCHRGLDLPRPRWFRFPSRGSHSNLLVVVVFYC